LQIGAIGSAMLPTAVGAREVRPPRGALLECILRHLERFAVTVVAREGAGLLDGYRQVGFVAGRGASSLVVQLGQTLRALPAWSTAVGSALQVVQGSGPSGLRPPWRSQRWWPTGSPRAASPCSASWSSRRAATSRCPPQGVSVRLRSTALGVICHLCAECADTQRVRSRWIVHRHRKEEGGVRAPKWV
jgi:hypothetical protein